MKRSIALIIVTLMMATTFGCGGTDGQGSTGTSTVKISIAGLKNAAAHAGLGAQSASVASILFTISASDMQTMTSTIPVTGSDTVTASFEVPNGSNRHFLAEALAADNTVLSQGDAFSDLSGNPANIDIVMGVNVSGEWTFTCTAQGSVPETDFIVFAQTGNSLSLVETTIGGSPFNGSGKASGNDIRFTVVGFACGTPFDLTATGALYSDGSLIGTFTTTGGSSGTWTAVRGHIISPLVVQPATRTVGGASGGTASFTISGGSAPYTVSSSNPSFPPSPAAVAASGGSFTVTVPAGTSGALTVTYTIQDNGGATVPATLIITATPPPAVTLVSIAVTPANPSIAVGATQQFTATGTYSDGSTHDMTTQATWSSSSTSVATVSSGGLAAGIAAGNATITAASGGMTGSTVLTVTSSSLPIGFPIGIPTGNYNIAVKVCVQGTCFSGQSFTEINADINQFAQSLVVALNGAAVQQQTNCSQAGVSCSSNIVYTPWDGTSFTITDNITVTTGAATETASIIFTVTKLP